MSSGARFSLAAFLATLLLTAALGCGGEREDGAGPAAGTEAGGAADGEGMEPRIVVEHPIDAPGRPADGTTVPVAPPEPAAAWVPHLDVADPDASLDFYRDLGFTVVSRQPEDGTAQRIELERDGARLVLVARVSADEEFTSEAADQAEPGAAPVLHLVDHATSPTRTLTDPDGHRLSLPAGP